MNRTAGAEIDRELILSSSTTRVLAQLEDGLKSRFHMSLAAMSARGDVVYPSPNGENVAHDDALSRLCAEVVIKKDMARAMVKGGMAYGVPMIDGTDTVGVLIALSDRLGISSEFPLDGSDVSALLRPFATMLGEAAAKDATIDSLTDEVGLRYEELTFIYELASGADVDQNLEPLLDSIFKSALTYLDLDTLLLFRPETGHMQTYVSPDISTDLTAAETESLTKLGLHAHSVVSATGWQWTANDVHEDDELADICPICSHLIAVPVNIGEDDQATLTAVRRPRKHRFFTGDVKLISTLARQVGMVMRNARLFGEVRSLFLDLVKSLVNIVEAKHRYTRGHSERVNAMCNFLAEKLELRDDDRETLHWASLFHDIGKISIPDAILNKPGKLTDEEFDAIKQHPREGHEMLSPIKQLRASLPGILHHHEKRDGSGYPDGIQGDKIPLIARIIAVADVYDAVTSARSYRDEMPVEKALDIMRQGEGSHFDPHVLDVFLQNHDKIVEALDNTDRILFDEAPKQWT